MRQPMIHVTENDAKDMLAALNGYIGSYTLQEAIGEPVNYKDFDNRSVDSIKEEMRKNMDALVRKEVPEGNLYTMDGERLVRTYLAVDAAVTGGNEERYTSIAFDENSSLDFSDIGLGFKGKFNVRMKDGSMRNLDLIVAPLYSMNSDDLCEAMIKASRNEEKTGAGRYFLNKYGNKTLSNSDDRALAAYDRIPDNTKDRLDDLFNNAMIIDWDDITPHEPQMVKTKLETKDQTLDESLCQEAEASKEKQMGE